jgi:hypothetical protein
MQAGRAGCAARLCCFWDRRVVVGRVAAACCRLGCAGERMRGQISGTESQNGEVFRGSGVLAAISLCYAAQVQKHRGEDAAPTKNGNIRGDRPCRATRVGSVCCSCPPVATHDSVALRTAIAIPAIAGARRAGLLPKCKTPDSSTVKHVIPAKSLPPRRRGAGIQCL